ncbi:MAG: hypothetical protein U0L79_07320 [Lachnospiraceae bacterium]|nr:hypothetical protein [Lachnospiraceae bacterium]
MIKNIKRGKNYITMTAAILLSTCLIAACSSKKDTSTATYSYGPELGLASGNVDLSSDTPNINISDIKSPVGENIDFLSGVSVVNADNYEDLEIWADASTIDIFTPGDYKVVYTFNYSGKSISKEVNVTIFEPENQEPEASEGNNTASNSDSNNENETRPSSGSNPNSTNTQDGSNNSSSNTGNNTGSNTGNNTGSAKPATTSKPNSGQTTKPVATTKPNNTQTNKPNSGQATTKKQTTTREIITTAGNKTTENKYIGNYTIELLSGKTITVQNSTSKYIVSTRTETSEITKNNAKYRVSKLIIKYSTGTEQVLETVEEKIQ